MLVAILLGVSGCKSEGDDGPSCWKGTRETNCTILAQSDLDETCSGWTGFTGNLYVDHVAVTGLDGLECLETIGSALAIQNNTQLTNVDGLRSLSTVGGPVNIDGNDALAHVDGLSHLSGVGGYLQFNQNPSLVNLDGLASLTTLGGDLLILSNDSLSSITGLSSLTSVGGANVIIMSNPGLPTCQATALADRLLAAGYTGDVIIAHNDDTATCD